jgi:histidyl-tRNA synthetase
MKRDLKADDLQAAADSGNYLDLADLGLRFDLTVPLARFYASHRAELPKVFRAIQIAPVWRAERPQKGRFRQFVQCDIDIIGEAGPLAEIELITATSAALQALGFTGDNACTIRINDRRILRRLTDYLGIPAEQYERALIVIDKEDKIGVDGVIAELAELGLGDADLIAKVLPQLSASVGGGWALLANTDADADADADSDADTDADADADADAAPASAPAWLDADAYRELLAIRDAVGDSARLIFSPNLVRGMGYYTGTIFEVAHPDLPYSLGGGGRYDGMIGRFLGSEVPAAGFSLGFERLVELVTLPDDAAADATALIYDADVEPARLASIKAELVATGARTTLAERPKNPKTLIDQLGASGWTRFAFVTSATGSAADLEYREISADGRAQ